MTLSRRELNRALLARQGLLDRFPPDLPDALRRIGGIQAQYAPAMYLGLWSRLADLERDAVTRALEDRSAIQATLLRSTIHLVAAGDFWPWAVAVRAARREGFLRGRPDAPPAAAMARAARRLRSRLAAGPMLRRDIEALLGKDAARGVGLWLDLVRVPPLGTWERRRADLYGLAEDWLAPVAISKTEAVEHVVSSYLSGFGPAPPGDVANWAGLKITDVRRAVARMELRRLRGPDGEELLDLPDAPLPAADTPAPPRFLPVWDATLLVHARRTQILPEELRPRVFSIRLPHGVSTFLVDGAVAGAWRLQDGRVELEPFVRLDAADRRALEAEAERLAAFAAD
ncbi:MAG TPA: winged helix DNA-binding domain-containing protein [Solirubrobacteraceae bacterium]|nr:winged helix DNA-binding domain-containing protein [Solirubrobacteraceae bacterium]